MLAPSVVARLQPQLFAARMSLTQQQPMTSARRGMLLMPAALTLVMHREQWQQDAVMDQQYPMPLGSTHLMQQQMQLRPLLLRL